ncbi:hypothetical protein K443DRAFT_402844 [Laccaria amethystina LaAM-08-1]|uniref:Nickel/cobalt efflux system n=1 Tax=Laccaria amethystina LaAM-08-1 TaxID=1095629 RepID=A0A0C9WQB4_9AGAR|nr:hypothetical protein K443DRAFT_402844 [Laccaria amethystina LaAM-08-1]
MHSLIQSASSFASNPQEDMPSLLLLLSARTLGHSQQPRRAIIAQKFDNNYFKGFDTASSMAPLDVSTLARKGADESSIPSSHVVIFPFLFAADMALVDSADSVLMLYSYSRFPERSFFSLKTERTLRLVWREKNIGLNGRTQRKR